VDPTGNMPAGAGGGVSCQFISQGCPTPLPPLPGPFNFSFSACTGGLISACGSIGGAFSTSGGGFPGGPALVVQQGTGAPLINAGPYILDGSENRRSTALAYEVALEAFANQQDFGQQSDEQGGDTTVGLCTNCEVNGRRESDYDIISGTITVTETRFEDVFEPGLWITLATVTDALPHGRAARAGRIGGLGEVQRRTVVVGQKKFIDVYFQSTKFYVDENGDVVREVPGTIRGERRFQRTIDAGFTEGTTDVLTQQRICISGNFGCSIPKNILELGNQ